MPNLRRATISAIAAATLMLLPADGRAARSAYIVGMGLHSCAEFGQDYKASPQYWEPLYFFWAQGYMSGINFLTMPVLNKYHDLTAMTIDEQMLRLRNYCDVHPLKSYYDAVLELFDSLPMLPTKGQP